MRDKRDTTSNAQFAIPDAAHIFLDNDLDKDKGKSTDTVELAMLYLS